MIVDFHVHDRRSFDGEAALEAHCRAAREAGVATLCVTNHVERLQEDGSFRIDLEEAVARFSRGSEEVDRLRSSMNGVALRLGAELEYRPEWTSALERLQERVPFDFTLGSLHVVDGHNVSGGPDVDRYFEGRTQAETYSRYFEAMLALVEWGAFDVVSHFDLVKRYGHRRYGPYRPQAYEVPIRRVLRRMAAAGLGLEINASGWFQAPGSAYPETAILAWAREEGVPWLTLGTDSHRPGHVGRGLRRALERAREAGWTEITTFRERRPRTHALEAIVPGRGGREDAPGGASR